MQAPAILSNSVTISCFHKQTRWLLLFTLLAFSFISSSAAVPKDTLTLKRAREGYDLESNWLTSKGDKPEWAQPNFDDSNWKLLEEAAKDSLDKKYIGIGWFRLHLVVDTEAAKKIYAFAIYIQGAGELYIDGKLVKRLGTLGINGKEEVSGFSLRQEPVAWTWDRPGEHVLALRMTNYSKETKQYFHINTKEGFGSFSMSINPMEDTLQDLLNYDEVATIVFFAGIFITLSLFHFVLFLYYRKNRSNLYYSLFTFLLSFIFYGVYRVLCGANLENTRIISILEIACAFLVPMFFLALLYQIFYKRLLPFYWILFGSLGVSMYFLFFTNNEKVGAVLVAFFLVAGMVETIRIFIRAWKKKKDGAGIFLFGILLPPFGTLLLALAAVVAGKLGYPHLQEKFNDLLGAFFGCSLLLSVSISMTIYLARDFARMNKKLQNQLREIKELFEKTIVQESERKRILENQKSDLERMVDERTKEVMFQKAEIELKNRDILDNLLYARRIQSAILPEIKLIYKTLSDSFILYRPKDIVSGDFYTFSQKERKVIIAAADCTGHGVTGAFMSMIGSSQLNQIVNERGITQPAEILNHLNNGIVEALKQTETDIHDGMDIALCSIDLDKLQLQYAGANRPLWMIRKGELQEIKADKLPIGGFRLHPGITFNNHEVQLEKGDIMYIFSDGYADQFGGPEGKKMLSKRLREELLSIRELPMKEQEIHLNKYFDDWRGTLGQVDDVLVIGIRI